MKVLVSSWDRIGAHMAGSAIRCLEIACGLAAAGHEVLLAAPKGSVLEPRKGLVLCEVGDSFDFARLVEEADVVMVSGRSELMNAISKPLLVDLYDPFVLSNLDLFGNDFNRAGGSALLGLRWLQHHLRYGDFFICASESQRSFWLGMLTAAGRVNRDNYEADPMLERLLAVVPFGVPDDPPPSQRVPHMKGVLPGIGSRDSVILWAGGMWNWVDPSTLIRAVAKLRKDRPDVHAVILGTKHPNPEIGEMEIAREAQALADDLGLVGNGVNFVEWVPYEERAEWILEADVGVSLHHSGVESQFAYRTRLLDYIWCGRPMVVTEGDELATLLHEKGLGTTVPPGDVEAVANSLVEVLRDRDDEGRRDRFAATRSELCWSSAIEPIEEFCANPRRAADRAGDSWVAGDAVRHQAPRKEQALVAEEFSSRARALSAPVGPEFSPRLRFEGRYDDLCQIEVLLWFDPPLDGSTLVLEITEAGASRPPLARVTVPAAQLPHNDWQRFEFRPIPESRGREFEIRLRLEHAPGEWDQRGRVCVWHFSPSGNEEPDPSRFIFTARYLVAGVASELPATTDDFLFLHNTTLPLEMGDEFLAQGGFRDAGPRVDDLDALRSALARLTVRAEGAELRAEDLHRQLREVEESLPRRVREIAGGGGHWRGLLRELVSPVRRLVGLLRRSMGPLLILLLSSISAFLAAGLGLAMLVVDALPVRRRGSGLASDTPPIRPNEAVSVVIPTWNGRSLLDMSLPPLCDALRRHGNPDDEIIVVDNGSDDGTVKDLRGRAAEFPFLRVVALDRNEGFAGATNRGAAEAKNRVVIFLNNDMVVEPDFVQPLLDVFGEEPDVFGVSCQIDFIDPSRPRWETGKVHAELRSGLVRLFHLDRFDEDKIYPIFFAGGGASAYDRERFLALGGFDEAVFSPVYIEDVDLGYRAWKRGWPSLLAPRSRVHHKHRGTTRRVWSEGVIHSFFTKNLAALLWKNTSSWRILAWHLLGLVVLPEKVRREQGARVSALTLLGLFRQIPVTLRARYRERGLPRSLGDEEILDISRFRHVYRARFHPEEGQPEKRPQVLVVSPYSPSPAVHGGAVRMLNLIREMRNRCDVTLISFVDTEAESRPESLAELRDLCRDVVLVPRDSEGAGGRLVPLAMHGFFSDRMFEMIEVWLEKRRFDVVQVEYTNMAHYLPSPCPGMLRVLVEHDVSFVAAGRAREKEPSSLRRIGLWIDGLRTFRHEINSIEQADRVLTMSEVDREVLARFVDPEPISVVPNGVSCSDFRYAPEEAEPATILFVGFFRHPPNVDAVLHFAHEILPLVRAEVPNAVFRIVGAYPPAAVRELAARDSRIEVLGRVPETASHYRRATVFVAPILSGSGTRLKILEAMASGCPVVATTVGAEGLGAGPRELVLADEPVPFARAITDLIGDAVQRRQQAEKARAFAESNFDWPSIAERLFDAYGWDAGPEVSDA